MIIDDLCISSLWSIGNGLNRTQVAKQILFSRKHCTFHGPIASVLKTKLSSSQGMRNKSCAIVYDTKQGEKEKQSKVMGHLVGSELFLPGTDGLG